MLGQGLPFWAGTVVCKCLESFNWHIFGNISQDDFYGLSVFEAHSSADLAAEWV